MSAPIDLISQVRAVTVYRRGAMVTRTAELLRDGAHFPAQVQLVGLPLSLDDSSMRVEVEVAEADGGFAPIAGDLRVSLSIPAQDPTLAPPSDDELDRATLALALIRAELEQRVRADARLARLRPTKRGAPEEGKPPAPSPTAARLELLSFRRERAERLAAEITALREREREAEQLLASLRERERLASTQRNVRTHELRKAAILALEQGEGAAERVRIKLRYFVPGARWAPAYTVRLDAGMREASLELRALVGQATGEDWSDVALTLSTADAQQWTELPKLESQRIGRRQPPPAKTGWRPPPVGAEALYADYDRGLGKPALEPAPSETALMDLERAEDSPPPPRPPAVRAPGPPGAPTPPRSMPMPGAPMPAGAPQPKGASRESSLGAMVEGAAASFGGGGGPQPSSRSGGVAPAPEPEPLLAGRELLDYGRLRLSPADSSRRGSLRRIGIRALYEQLSGEDRASEAIESIKRATAQARALDYESAPERHDWPASADGFDYAYVADAPSDLCSDGQFHSLAIDRREAEATPRYIAVPRETQDVFRIVALRNPLDAPLLPGPADVYVAGKFVSSSAVALTPVGGRIELGLGVEQAIKIARNVSFTEDSSGMFKRQLELRHSVAIEIANHLARPATVEVRERVPIAGSGQADIEVVVVGVEPRWDDYEPEDPPLEGGRRWVIEVPANAKRELEARWTVTIPTQHELIGGNRRED